MSFDPTRILAESENYKIVSEYEYVNLIFKKSGREVRIGHFYGDPEGAFVDVNEKYCVMYGCGVIVYFLNEPFEEYWYCIDTTQWQEYGREPQNILWVRNCIPDLIRSYPECDEDKILWVENACQIDNGRFKIILENKETRIIKISLN